MDIDKNAVVVQILGLIYPYLHGLVQPRDSNLQKEQLIAGAGPPGAEPAASATNTPANKANKQKKAPTHDFPAQDCNKNAQEENIIRINTESFR